MAGIDGQPTPQSDPSNPAILPSGPSSPAMDTLSEYQKGIYDVLTGKEDDKGTLGWMFNGLQDALEDLQDSFADGLPGADFLAGTGGGAAGALGGGGGTGFPSKPIPNVTKERPTIQDMVKLPAEFSMGYLLLYWKLDEMHKDQKSSSAAKETGGGIGGFFSNLLKGAEGIALIAIGLIAFAGAMFLFQFVKWDPALLGLVAFGLFVVGMVLIAKTLGNNLKDFEKFSIGILLMTAGIILFNVAVWISAKIHPYLGPALETIAMFSIFVGLMVVVASLLGNELGNFTKFALGVLVMTGAIILFDIAIFITSMIRPFIPGAMEGLVLFGEFVAAAAILALVLGSLIEPFVLMAVGVILLDVALLLFGLVITQYSKLLPKIPDAKTAIIASGELLAEIAIMALLAIPLLIPVVALAASLILISAAFLLWGAALSILNLLHPLLPGGRTAIQESFGLLGELSMMSLLALVVLIPVVAFAAGIIVISAAFMLWAAALAVMGLVSGLVPAGLKGIGDSLGLLTLLGVMSLGAILVLIPVAAFAAGIVVISAAFILWGVALGVLGALSPLIPKGLQGIQDSMGVLGQIALASVLGLAVLIPVVAFAAGVAVISAAFLLWGAALAVIGKIDSLPAQDSIRRILDTFRLISQSITSETSAGVTRFAKNLTEVGYGLQALMSSNTQGFPAFVDSLTKLSTVNIGDTFKPLIDLTTHQKEIDNLAQSLERISKAIKPPPKTIWDTVSNLTGGNVANPQATSGEGVEKKKTDVGPSAMEKLLTEIRDRLMDWDVPIRAIAKNTEDIDSGTTVMVAAANAGYPGGMQGPISPKK